MGDWGLGSFENDSALDLVVELCEADDIAPVVAALRVVAENAGYVDIADSFAAVAAAEVAAALCGKASRALPEGVSTWVEAHPAVSREHLADMALRAVTRMEMGSELREETGDSGEWWAIMADLRIRLEECLPRKPPD